MISVDELLSHNLDPIPEYLLLRDIVKLPAGNQLLLEVKQDVLQTKWVKNITALQQRNGSWGYFHSLSLPDKYTITTEQALRRLRILGLDSSDLYIKNALDYMERVLCGEEELPDRREKLHDWTIFTQLMLATQIRQFMPENKPAMDISNKWKGIIEYTFSNNEFSQNLYEEAYSQTFSKKPKGGRILDFVHFYTLTLLRELLSEETECRMIDYVIDHPNGIYYIYDGCLNKLPDNFASKQASRYLTAIELLSPYAYAKGRLLFVTDWLMNNAGQDGFWDMSASVKDGIAYPLSNSWKSTYNRKIDCTIRIMSLLNSLK